MNRKSGLAIILVLVALQKLTGQQSPNPPTISGEDAGQLVTAALRGSGAASLPGFGLEQAQTNHLSGFIIFDATWDNPNGSVVIGHYAVDLMTGDVWNAIVC